MAMRLPSGVTNATLGVLLEHSGFRSLQEFADAVNAAAYHAQGLRFSHTNVTVIRWLRGRVCQHPETVAAVLSKAWGVPVPPEVIWPDLRAGKPPPPPHLIPWVASRTLEELSIFLRRDMLSRRELLNQTVLAATGAAFAEPFLRWAQLPAVPLPDNDRRPGQIGMEEVARVEAAKHFFNAEDAAAGGGLSRKAAAGQLLDAIDLFHDGHFTSAVRDRLLVAISELAATVGWMSHDTGLEGVAQRYFVLSAQAAGESRHERARRRYVAPLLNLARQHLELGDPDTGLDLIDHAQVSLGRGDTDLDLRALMWNLRGRLLAAKGPSCLREMESALGLAFDISPDGSRDPSFIYANPAEFHGVAGEAYLHLATHDARFARRAEEHLERALQLRAPDMTRSLALDTVTLARARLAAGKLEQGAVDGDAALALAGSVTGSRRIGARLRALGQDAARYDEVPAVRDFRVRLSARV